MIIFEATLATGYEMVVCSTYEDGQILAAFDGSSRRDAWTPPHVYRTRATKRSAGRPADLPFRGDTLIMRRKALDALQDTILQYGEVLPLATDDDVELFVLNVRVVIDALDKERSVMVPIEGTDIIKLRDPVFIESAIRDVEIFRVPMKPSRVYYSDRFVERVKAAKLKGTDFIKLWSSE